MKNSKRLLKIIKLLDNLTGSMTNNQIAKKMNIAYDTLRSHITIVYSKTGKTRYKIISEGRE